MLLLYNSTELSDLLIFDAHPVFEALDVVCCQLLPRVAIIDSPLRFARNLRAPTLIVRYVREAFKYSPVANLLLVLGCKLEVLILRHTPRLIVLVAPAFTAVIARVASPFRRSR